MRVSRVWLAPRLILRCLFSQKSTSLRIVISWILSTYRKFYRWRYDNETIGTILVYFFFVYELNLILYIFLFNSNAINLYHYIYSILFFRYWCYLSNLSLWGFVRPITKISAKWFNWAHLRYIIYSRAINYN